MPTGYTAKLVEQGQTFQEFVLTCARAFGACISLRDEPNETPIPDKFEPSTYHAEQIKEAEEKLKSLKAMTLTQQLEFGMVEKDADNARYKEYIQKNTDENNRLTAMALMVGAWVPPTPEHTELKAFMLQQIKVSMSNSDYWDKQLKESEEKPVISYYEEAVATVERDIKYHTKELAEEIRRTDEQNEWVRKLRESI